MVAAKLTVSEKSLTLDTVSVDVTDAFLVIVKILGLAVITKSWVVPVVKVAVCTV